MNGIYAQARSLMRAIRGLFHLGDGVLIVACGLRSRNPFRGVAETSCLSEPHRCEEAAHNRIASDAGSWWHFPSAGLIRADQRKPLQETYKTLIVSALFPIQRARFRLSYLRLCDAPRASIPDQRIGTHARCRFTLTLRAFYSEAD